MKPKNPEVAKRFKLTREISKDSKPLQLTQDEKGRIRATLRLKRDTILDKMKRTHPDKEGLNGIVGKSTTKRNKLVVGLWKTSQNYEVKTSH